jgi:hypothetical protein
MHIGRVVRKFAFLAFLGFLVIVLSGPVLAIVSTIFSLGLALLSVLLPFAFLGLLFWVPFRLLSRGAHVAGQDIRDTGKALGQIGFGVPYRACAQVCSGAGEFGQRVRTRTHAIGSLVGGILLETFSGAAVGTVLGVVESLRSHGSLQSTIMIGTGIGGLLGAVVGISRPRRTELAFQGQAPEGLV